MREWWSRMRWWTWGLPPVIVVRLDPGATYIVAYNRVLVSERSARILADALQRKYADQQIMVAVVPVPGPPQDVLEVTKLQVNEEPPR